LTRPFDAVLFDCDGVLVDSETITHQVLCEMLAVQGWSLTVAECMDIFLGKAVRDERARIEAATGRPLTDAWLAEFRVQRNARLMQQLQPVRHAVEGVVRVHRLLQGRIACCSGADRVKVEMQLGKVGLMPYFEGRIFSGHEMPRSKPAPDVYLAAMDVLQVAPARCLVLEDTVTGVRAGAAAGACVVGYSPPETGHDGPAALRAAGAHGVIRDLRELPGLLDAP